MYKEQVFPSFCRKGKLSSAFSTFPILVYFHSLILMKFKNISFFVFIVAGFDKKSINFPKKAFSSFSYTIQ